MRILINIDEVRNAKKQKTVRVRIGYDENSSDCMRVYNCGIEIYNLVKEAFTGGGFTGGEVVIEGKRR